MKTAPRACLQFIWPHNPAATLELQVFQVEAVPVGRRRPPWPLLRLGSVHLSEDAREGLSEVLHRILALCALRALRAGALLGRDALLVAVAVLQDRGGKCLGGFLRKEVDLRICLGPRVRPRKVKIDFSVGNMGRRPMYWSYFLNKGGQSEIVV